MTIHFKGAHMQFISRFKITAVFLGALLGFSFMAGSARAENEMFTDRVKQISTEKGKAAVYVVDNEFTVAKLVGSRMGSSMSSLPQRTPIKGPMPTAYLAIADVVAKELNNGLGTDAFASIKYKDVPKKTTTVFGAKIETPDWAKTEYKLYVEVLVTGSYNPKKSIDGKSYSADFSVNTDVYVYTMDGEKKKYVLDGMGVGYEQTPAVKYPAELNTYTEYVSTVGADTALAEKISVAVTEKMAKVVEKLKEMKM